MAVFASLKSFGRRASPKKIAFGQSEVGCRGGRVHDVLQCPRLRKEWETRRAET